MSYSRAGGNKRGPRDPARQGGRGLQLHELARLRQAAYRLFGSLFLYPDDEWSAVLRRVAEGLLADSQPLSRFAFWGRWQGLLDSLQRVDRANRAALEAEYVDTLVTTSYGAPCLPYESAYFPPEAAAGVLAELDRAYARAGFRVAPAFTEPPDHAAVELEFMSLLCGGEAEAWRQKNRRDGVERLEREVDFLSRHLGRWFPEFAERIAARSGGFYAVATDAARAFIAHDLELVTGLLERYREAACA